MSRSYKKIPCCKDHNKGMKKYANRYVRRNFLVVPSGTAYKKLFFLGIFVIISFWNHFLLIKNGVLSTIIKVIQMQSYIECGTNIIK